MKPQEVKITITPESIISIALTALGLWVLFQVRDILVLFLISLALVIAFSPIIKTWQKYMPRIVAILLLYALLVLSIIIVIALIIPPLFSQLNDFLVYVQNSIVTSGFTGDSLLQRVRDNITLVYDGKVLQALGQFLGEFKGSVGLVYTRTLGIIGTIVAIITVFITSFYLLNEENNFENFLMSAFPRIGKKHITQVLDRLSNKLGSWLLGQLSLMVIVGILDAVALSILGVPYALLLGLWAGLMELLPVVGPIAGAIPGVIIAFTTLGLVKGIIAIVIYFLVQQIENQLLVPKIMGRALGLSPVTIIFSLLIGGKLLGFVGLLIAIPVAAALSVVYQEWRSANSEGEMEAV